MEEGHNQPKIAPKRIKLQEMKKKGERDRISELPDCLLIEILSRLPTTADAIITGSLSKRWKHVWTWVHTLIFIYLDDTPVIVWQDPKLRSDFISFVAKTLTQCRQLKLKKFKMDSSYDDIESASHFNNWIRYAICCNVEELHIILWHNFGLKFLLDQSFFISSCFTDLKLSGCKLNPSGAISWTNLRSLCIFSDNLNEDLIENILSGSPVLETLVLECCYGYKRLNITSKSVKKLVLIGYGDLEDKYDDDDDVVDDIIEINAPHILSLKIQGDLLLWKLLLVNVSSVGEANLDYSKMGYWEGIRKEEEAEMLKAFIIKLNHANELKIGSTCSKALYRLEANGFTFPSNTEFPDGFLEQLEQGDWSDSDSVESEEL